MITINNNNIVRVTAKGRIIAYIYNGATLVWQAIRSCFGSGRWITNKPWLYNEGWKLVSNN